MTSRPRILEVRQHVLRKNDELARALRDRFTRAGVLVVSLVSSPGAGKTALLEDTLRRLGARHRVAALVGDLATDRDAQRLARAAVQVRQITTGTVCHLDAAMVERAIAEAGWALAALDVLFVENVGNLVCPASYDLGEGLRAVLLSVTEGEDKPLKYPTIFDGADCAVVTKTDMAAAAGFDREALLESIESVRPNLPVIEVSVRTGAGVDAWIALLERERAAIQTRTANAMGGAPAAP